MAEEEVDYWSGSALANIDREGMPISELRDALVARLQELITELQRPADVDSQGERPRSSPDNRIALDLSEEDLSRTYLHLGASPFSHHTLSRLLCIIDFSCR